MCGILGIVGRTPTGPTAGNLQQALQLLKHRGPNDEGYLLVNSAVRCVHSLGGADTSADLGLPSIHNHDGGAFDVAFGFRRLSILDVSTAGHQPMLTPDGRFGIIFNGEVYNFIELRRELEQRGHQFRSGSDTEVILCAYTEWGPSMLSRFVGMFAMAILDIAERTVFIARDPFGIKPLYWTRSGGMLAFASEIAPLLSLIPSRHVADVDALYRYMRFGTTDGHVETMFAGVYQLPAAHYMIVGADGTMRQDPLAYWTPGAVSQRNITIHDAASELAHLFDESIRLHLRSDVPLGSCLSGGLDSTAIVASMRAQLGADAPIHAFSFVSDDPRTGEGPYVDIAARAFGLQKHSVFPSSADLVADLEMLVRSQEQPFDSTSIYAQFSVFRLAHAAGITVMLDGQGADELFGGYATALSAQLSSALLRGDLASVRSLLMSPHMTAPGMRRRIGLSALGRLLPMSLVSPIMSFVGEALYPEWLDAAWFRRNGHRAEPRPQGRGRDSLREELVHFVRTLSLPRLLRYEDRNSMAFSIESRVPFCTVALADFAFSLPPTHLVGSDGETKVVLRRAMRNRIPREIIERPKVGFETPERAWLAAMRPWITDVVRSESFRSLPFITHERVDHAIDAQLNETGALRPMTWRFLNVAAWARQFNVEFPK